MPRTEKERTWEHPRSLGETVQRFPVALRGVGLLEWVADWFLYGFDRLALLRLTIQSALAVSVVGGVLALILDLADREEERVLRAWKVLADGESVQGNIGQKAAVEFLHSKGKALAKVRLSGAALAGVALNGGDLREAALENADLSGAVLSNANLNRADLRGANLSNADLSGADLRAAAFKDANFRHANLNGADLRGSLFGGYFCRTRMPDGSMCNSQCDEGEDQSCPWIDELNE